MKGQLGSNNCVDSVTCEEPEPVEVWTEEELRRRSRELHLIDLDIILHKSGDDNSNLAMLHTRKEYIDNRCDSVLLSDVDGSPSKSTTSGSQVSV